MNAPDPRAVITPNGAALGTWIKLSCTETIEMMAQAGFDFVVIDMEHSALSRETVSRHIALARALGMSPMVRIGDHSPSTVQLMLDTGAHGLFVPRVDTFDQAQAVAAAFSFPPVGIRGSGGTSRAGSWGLDSADTYRAFGRENAMLIVQLEAESGIHDAHRIAQIPQVSALFVGTADLALSLGEAPASQRVHSLIDTAREAAQAAGKPFGLAGASATAGAEAFAAGTNFFVASNDATMLATAARTLVRNTRA